MAGTPRNAEIYRRRIERLMARGLSRSAARGHARVGELSARPPKTIPDDRLQVALKVLRDEGSLTKAAKAARIAPERLRHLASRDGLIRKDGRRWGISPDVKRSIEIFTLGERKVVTVASFEDASLAGQYEAAVRRFLNTNERAFLIPFEGKTVRDIAGHEHPLEADPNVLYQLGLGRDHAAEHIYRIHM